MYRTDIRGDREMEYYDRRLETFNTYPKQLVPSKYELAQAGLYYTGKSDKVICFQCGVNLKDWKRDDNAMNEHQKWSPHCEYVKMVGGIFLNSDMDVIG